MKKVINCLILFINLISFNSCQTDLNSRANEYYEQKEYKNAFYLYKKAAEKGDVYAQYCLGFMLDNAQGVPEDDEEAFKWYRKSAEQGNPDAMIELGSMYIWGRGVKEDRSLGIKWFEKAADKGSVRAMMKLARNSHSGNQRDFEKEFKWYLKAAEHNNIDAMKEIVRKYLFGEGVKADSEKAAEWASKIGKLGKAEDFHDLAFIYNNPQRKNYDFSRELFWLEKAGNAGHLEAQMDLYEIYYERAVYGTQDYNKAFMWIKMAAEQNDPNAQYLLAKMYQKGKGTTKDIKLADKWFKKSFQKCMDIVKDFINMNEEFDYSSEYYKIKIADMYLQGEGVQQNDFEAIKWYNNVFSNHEHYSSALEKLWIKFGFDKLEAEELADDYFFGKCIKFDAIRNLNLGLISYKNKKYTDAVKYLKEAAKHLPDNYEIHNKLAKAYMILGENNEAVKQIAKADFLKKSKHGKIAGKPSVSLRGNQLKSTIITPYLQHNIEKSKNLVWCVTLQLCWNSLCKMAGGNIQMENGPNYIKYFNNQKITENDLSETCYVARIGWINKGIISKIEEEIKEKFENQANLELLDTLEGPFIVYSYLFKHLPFEWKFTRFNSSLKFGNETVDSFGINQYSEGETNEDKMADQVSVLYYKNNDDFIIELKTKSKDDHLILAKMKPLKTLLETINSVLEITKKSKPSKMKGLENLEIPVINFQIINDFLELKNKKLISKNPKFNGQVLNNVIQLIRFRLDEAGAILQSECGIDLCDPPRDFTFDKPFLLMIIQKNAEVPYFALWIDNAELLEKSLVIYDKKSIEEEDEKED